MSKKVEVIELSDSSDAVSIEKGIEGSSKPLIPPFGSAKRPRPEVVARVAEMFRTRTVPKNVDDCKTTWATMVKKMGIKGAGNTGKGKEKVQLRVQASASDGLFLVPASDGLFGWCKLRVFVVSLRLYCV
ncbi:hypothetical protein Tco_0493196 [Tanacetum coccineum]